MYAVRTKETVTTPFLTISRTKKSAISMCLVADDKTGFVATATTPRESEKRSTLLQNREAWPCRFIEPNSFQRNFASRAAIAAATSSEWFVEVVTKEWSFDFHDNAHPEKKNTYAKVDLRVSRSSACDASKNPYNPGRTGGRRKSYTRPKASLPRR
jgi:hypothetical protein